MPAAIAAARAGRRVLLLERYGVLGGTISSCMMGGFIGYAPTPVREEDVSTIRVGPDQLVLGGIPMEFVEHACKMGATPPWEEISWDTVRIDPEMFKIVCDKLCTQAGVNVLFHTLATDVLAENGHITGVVVETKTGRKLVTGKVSIDATADGDIAYHAGTPWQ